MTEITSRLSTALADRYRIEQEIGSGGMATVYLAEDLKHHRKVAVKVLRPELAAALGEERFLREISITAGLDHPLVLPLLDSGALGGFLFYVMPFVEGESLADRLGRERQLPLDDALQIAREVADALSYAHSHDVIHRDIKPDNILLSGGHARVADFGIARAISASGGEHLTQTGLAIGTPTYMSPEQAGGEAELDGRSDIYSLACVLYEMLAGEPPFTGPSVQAVLARKAVGEVPHITTVRELVPAHVEAAVLKALARVPADRFITAQQFSDALASPAPGAVPASPPLRKFVVLAIAGSAVVVVALALGLTGRLPFVVRPAAASFFSERDRVIVAEFTNQTDQPALGLAVREAVVTDLHQSAYVNTVDRGALTGALERMRLPDSTVIDADVAVEIARRQGYPAVVAGGVTPLGAGYQLSVRIIEASTGEVAIRLRETAADDGEVVSAVERLVRQARGHLGESLRSVRRSDPLPRVTTASLEALQLSARATAFGLRGEYQRAIVLLEQAVQLDTAFAAAYRGLGIYYGNIGRIEPAQRNVDLAYRHSDRLHPRERYLIRATYNGYRGRMDSAAFYYERLLDRYPNDPTAVNNLGDAYERMGRYDESLRLYRRAVEIEPSAASLFNLGSAARTLDLPAVADSVEALMVERFPNIWLTGLTQHQNALYAGNQARQEQIAHDMSVQTDYLWPRGFGRYSRAGLHAMHGQLDAALALADSAIDPMVESGSQLGAYRPLRTATWAAFAAGEPERALPLIDRVPDPSTLAGAPGFRYLALGFIAQVHALSGNLDEARSFLDRMDSLVAANDFCPYAIGEHLRAMVALQEGRAEESLAHLRRAQEDEFGLLHHSSRLLLAETYVALGRMDLAAAHFDTLANTYGLNFNDVGSYQPLRPVAHERAAGAYLALGDTATALEHLGAFMALWKDADPELQPIVTRTRERMAALMERR